LGELRRATANLPGAVCSTPPALSNTGGAPPAPGARAGTPLTDTARARGFSHPAAIKEVPDMAKKPAPAPSLAIRSCVQPRASAPTTPPPPKTPLGRDVGLRECPNCHVAWRTTAQKPVPALDWTADPANLWTVLLTGILVALAVIAIFVGAVWVAALLAGWI
jgi:hypothetical protein